MFFHKLLSAFTLFCVATSTHAGGLVPLNDRDDLFGWEAIGRINIGKEGYCTGALIASDLVLTAAHCVYDSRSGKQIEPDQLTFKAGLQNGKSIAQSSVKMLVADKRYNPRFGTSALNIKHDVAILQLETPIPTFTAAPFVLNSDTKAGTQVSVVSYGKGRDETLSWQRSCDMLGRRGGLMAFDCDVTFGSSGAPVFMKQGNRVKIVSLISSGTKLGTGTISYGMELSKTVPHLKNQLRNAASQYSGIRKDQKIKRIKVGANRSATGAKFIKN